MAWFVWGVWGFVIGGIIGAIFGYGFHPSCWYGMCLVWGFFLSGK